jgi:hypothetical protein
MYQLLNDKGMWPPTPLLPLDLVKLFSDAVDVALKLDGFGSFRFL